MPTTTAKKKPVPAKGKNNLPKRNSSGRKPVPAKALTTADDTTAPGIPADSYIPADRLWPVYGKNARICADYNALCEEHRDLSAKASKFNRIAIRDARRELKFKMSATNNPVQIEKLVQEQAEIEPRYNAVRATLKDNLRATAVKHVDVLMPLLDIAIGHAKGLITAVRNMNREVYSALGVAPETDNARPPHPLENWLRQHIATLETRMELLRTYYREEVDTKSKTKVKPKLRIPARKPVHPGTIIPEHLFANVIDDGTSGDFEFPEAKSGEEML